MMYNQGHSIDVIMRPSIERPVAVSPASWPSASCGTSLDVSSAPGQPGPIDERSKGRMHYLSLLI